MVLAGKDLETLNANQVMSHFNNEMNNYIAHRLHVKNTDLCRDKMALSKVAHDLNQLLTCAVCLETFTDPRVLSCIHSFCVKCLNDVYQTKVAKEPASSGYIICPTCRVQTTLPEDSVYKLPSYFVAEQVSDVVAGLSTAQLDSVHVCSRCRRGNCSVAFCFDCSQTMCADCLETHTKRKGNNEHLLVETEKTTVKSLFCKEHNEFCTDFCLQCNSIACSRCHVSTHKEHKRAEFCLLSDEIVATAQSVCNKTDSCERSLKRCRDGQKNFIQHAEIVTEKIDKHVERTITIVQKQGETMKDEIHAAVDSTYTMVKKAKTALTQMSKNKYLATMMMKPLSDIPALSLDCVDSIGETYLPFTYVPHPKNLDFIPSPPLDMTPNNFGVLRTPKDCNSTWQKIGQRDIKLRTVDILPNGHIIAIDCDSDLVCIDFEYGGNCLPLPQGVETLGKVSKLSVHKENHLLALVGENGKWCAIITMGKDRWNFTRYNLPFVCEDVAFDPLGRLVFLMKDKRMMSLTSWGKKLWQKQLNYSGHHITVSDQCEIIVTEGPVKITALHIYSSNGVKLRELNDFPMELGYVAGVATDHEGNIYVPTSSHRGVLMFNRYGKFIKTVITWLQLPSASGCKISLYEQDTDKLLVLCNSMGSLIQYKLD